MGQGSSSSRDTPATFETPLEDPKQTPRPPVDEPITSEKDGPTHNPEPHEVKCKTKLS